MWESGGYRAHLDALAERGLADVREAPERPYHEREGITCRLCVIDIR